MLARLVSGIVGLCVVLPIVIYGGPNSVWWLMLPFLVIALDEYVRMATPTVGLPARVAYHTAGLGLAAVAVHAPDYLLVTFGVLVMTTMTVTMLLQTDVELAANQAVRLAFGLGYVPLLMAPLAYIRQEPDGVGWIFFLLASTWLGDTGAYFAGRGFGKTPLFPRVSPKKTVEGALGGLLAAIAGACVFKAFLLPNMPWLLAILVSGLLDIAGVVGDLAESMLKRAFGVKDSGTIMPGHGGVLDRIDSLLFTGPLLWAFIVLHQTHPA